MVDIHNLKKGTFYVVSRCATSFQGQGLQANGNWHLPGAAHSSSINKSIVHVAPHPCTATWTYIKEHPKDQKKKKKQAYVNNINKYNLLEILNFNIPAVLH